MHVLIWTEAAVVVANEYFRCVAPMFLVLGAVALAPVWWIVCGVLLALRTRGDRDYWPLVSAILQPFIMALLAWPAALAGLESSSIALGTTVSAIEEYTADHEGQPPESLDSVESKDGSFLTEWRTTCQQPSYRKVSPYFGTYIYELGPGDSTLAGSRNVAFLRVSILDEVRVADYGLDPGTLSHQLAFSGERWRESRMVRRRMARAFTSEEFQSFARKLAGDNLARKVFEVLGPADRSYAPTSPWELDLTACAYAWGRLLYWPGQRYPDRMGGMRLKGRIGAWAYYYDDRLF